MEKELAAIRGNEASHANTEADWQKKVQDFEGELKRKETESTGLQAALAKESARISSNAAVVAEQTTTIKNQKERLTELKTALSAARTAHADLKRETEVLGQKKEEREKELVEKEQQRQDAQRNALEASRLREQMNTRRRVVNKTPKKGLLEAFQLKVDFEEQKSGLRSTGSLLLKEAQNEHERSVKHDDTPSPSQSPRMSNTTNAKSLVTTPVRTSSNVRGSPSSPQLMPIQQKRTPPPQLIRRQSVLQELLANQPEMLDVRIGGVRLTVAELTMYERMFSHYDNDRSGTIDGSELRSLLRELGKEVSDEYMVILMKELDRDGNGSIEFSEFLQGMDFLNQLTEMNK